MAEKIRQAKDMADVTGEVNVAYLRGVITPNGEFVSSGNCFWIREDPDARGNSVSLEDIFIKDYEE